MLGRLWTIGVIFFLTVSSGYGQEKGGQGMITVTGVLVTIAAIGGETTGWAVDLDSPLLVEGKKLNRVEIDPGEAGEKTDGLKGRRVEVVGSLGKRFGIERKEYWVLTISAIHEMKQGYLDTRP